MKKLTLILMIALLIPAAGVLGQMQWQDKDTNKEVFIYETKGQGRGMNNDMGHGMRQGVGMRGHGGLGIMAMAEELELTDDQKENIQKLALDHKLAAVDSHAAVKKAEISLQALMHEDDADQGKVFSGIDKLATLKADVKKAAWSHHQKVKGLLTEEQQEKLKDSKLRGRNAMFFGEPGSKSAHGMKKGMTRKVIHIDDD